MPKDTDKTKPKSELYSGPGGHGESKHGKSEPDPKDALADAEEGKSELGSKDAMTANGAGKTSPPLKKSSPKLPPIKQSLPREYPEVIIASHYKRRDATRAKLSANAWHVALKRRAHIITITPPQGDGHGEAPYKDTPEFKPDYRYVFNPGFNAINTDQRFSQLPTMGFHYPGRQIYMVEINYQSGGESANIELIRFLLTNTRDDAAIVLFSASSHKAVQQVMDNKELFRNQRMRDRVFFNIYDSFIKSVNTSDPETREQNSQYACYLQFAQTPEYQQLLDSHEFSHKTLAKSILNPRSCISCCGPCKPKAREHIETSIDSELAYLFNDALIKQLIEANEISVPGIQGSKMSDSNIERLYRSHFTTLCKAGYVFKIHKDHINTSSSELKKIHRLVLIELAGFPRIDVDPFRHIKDHERKQTQLEIFTVPFSADHARAVLEQAKIKAPNYNTNEGAHKQSLALKSQMVTLDKEKFCKLVTRADSMESAKALSYTGFTGDKALPPAMVPTVKNSSTFSDPGLTADETEAKARDDVSDASPTGEAMTGINLAIARARDRGQHANTEQIAALQAGLRAIQKTLDPSIKTPKGNGNISGSDSDCWADATRNKKHQAPPTTPPSPAQRAFNACRIFAKRAAKKATCCCKKGTPDSSIVTPRSDAALGVPDAKADADKYNPSAYHVSDGAAAPAAPVKTQSPKTTSAEPPQGASATAPSLRL